MDRLDEIFELAREEPDPPGAVEATGIRQGIRFEGVTFSYDDEPVLVDATFEIPAGRTVALVGPSGSGKTTIAMLLLRLAEPQQGRIMLDGRDITEISRSSLRALFGLVSQEPVLLNDTIEANICLGLEADQQSLEDAARAAGAHGFVTALPEGYQSSVGEAGARLSGGERQRLCMARALLRDPPALVLDEATAAVDSATEAEIASALEVLMQGRTTLLISHRLSTVRRADDIVVLDQGRVVARGTYDELRRESEEFREVFCDQLPA
jgi:ABC-type multidrug transport system fused ATPase/permease subunit